MQLSTFLKILLRFHWTDSITKGHKVPAPYDLNAIRKFFWKSCIAVEFFDKICVEFYGSGSHVAGTHLVSVTILVGGKFCNLESTGFDHGKMIK